MARTPKGTPDLLALLYDGLLWPDRWSELLAEISKRIGCDLAAISFHDSRNRTPLAAFSMGISREMEAEWTSHYGSRNPFTQDVLRAMLRTGPLVTTTSLHEAPASYQSTEYAAWCRRTDLYHSLMTTVPYGRGIGIVSLARPKSSRPFPQNGLKLMKQLMPHLERVLQVHERNETLRALFEAGKIALDSLDTGVVAVDEQARIVLVNKHAETVLAKEQGVTVRRGSLTAKHAPEASELERLLKSAAMTGRGRGTANGGAITIHRNEGSVPLSVTVTPLPSNGISGGHRPCALVFISDPAAKPASRAQALRSLFALTPAECRLAARLHEGLDLRNAAATIGVTAETARFMLKSIFRKTGSHRQSQLIHMLNRLPGEVEHSVSRPRPE